MHVPFLPFRLGPPLPQLIRRLTAACGIGLVCTTAALAQFPRIESFKNTTTSGTGFRLGGNPKAAVLTAASGTDADGSGYLRLTDSGNNQSGFAIDKSSFPAPSGFSISFEFYSYGGNGADGFSVFLIDADKTSADAFTIGASGGSLGYAQKTSDPISDGVPNGYVGIGIDEFGNFANPTEGRVGGPGSRPDAVSLRGPGNGRSATDYPYLAGSGSLPFSLDVATVRAQQGNADFRRAYIDVIPQTNGTYQITVRIQHGNAVTTAVNRVTISTPPSNLRIGFSGSTGAVNNFHEIRNLAIVKAPFANDDVAGTKYNVPVTLNILNNDIAQGSNLDLASVDLNPNTAAIENSYTVAGQGTFQVNSSGVVTFTPSGTFSGVVTIPYTVASILGDRSSPANIVVTVTGADVATTIGGPTSVNPGSSTSYTVTAVNNGQEVATNLIPTLTLPTNVSYVSGGSFNLNTRVVSFPQTTLTSGQSVTNSVVVTMPPTTGNYTFTSNYTYPSGAAIPDAEPSNNSSAFVVAVSGSGNIAGVCSIPGKDGPVTLTSATIPNTYYAGTGTASAGNKFLTVSPTLRGNTTAIAPGDMLLILQTQGTKMTIANSTAYGDVNTVTAGTYEYAIAASAVNTTTGQLDLTGALQNTYTTNIATTNISANAYQTFQVIRIPQYSSVTVSGTVTGSAWNGSTGGVLALEVAGKISFTSGSLNMDGKGFRGGASQTNANANSANNSTYVTTSTAYAAKGEGIAGAPSEVFDGSSNVSVTPNYTTFASGSFAAGNAANGGGGGARNGNNYSGGSGGSNGGASGSGQNIGNGSNRALGGIVAATNSSPSDLIWLGGGGGAGAATTASSTTSGRNGGGMIILRTGVVATTGTISVNGLSTPNATGDYGSGGGGAGGTVVVRGTSLNQLTITATGGNGGVSTNAGNGGGGGGGVILSNAAVGGSSSVAGGTVNNTASGSAGYTSTSTTLGTDCMPNITATLSTTTPQVNRSAAMRADYVLVVANTGGGVTGASVTAGLNSLFTYTNTANTTKVDLVLADGTISTIASSGYTVNSTTANSPVFLGFNIPSGASLRISFRAAIASSAVNGTAYQGGGTTSYLDPTRTGTNNTVSPGAAMASGITAMGSNYLASSSSAEDVTVVQPLPVTLTSFEAKAAGRDALLTWATAQELNNDRFEVERSLNGIDFEKIGSVKGKGTTSTASAYTFTDAAAARLTAKTLYYRLHQLDLDGPGSYTKVRTVRFERAQGTATLYPNPHQGRFTLNLQALPSGIYQVDILDLAGRRVYHTQLSGGQEHPLLPTLPMGSYIVHVTGQTVNVNLPMVKN
ncbi:T9SS type A sorting domain-containing protein [Hymenobacter sp. UYP22]|uniref:Ig-like domain-containing protein n=1 Tax=Hymenobacter sp. UYP22 TaxID=3156348 RepID=UPI0033981350